MEILIFVHEVNNRVAYAFDLIFKQLLGVRYRLTSDKEAYFAYLGPKFAYRKTPIDKGLFFYSADLLFETKIYYQNLQVVNYEGVRVFYLNDNYGCLPFDPFAASFYLVSRYEEYITKQRDGHNRFDPNFSLAKRNNFLQIPVVNYYAEIVRDKVLASFPNMVFPEKKYTFLPTIDIDNAFAYKHKGAYRVLPTILSSLVKLKFKDLKKKMSIFFGDEQDPYDTFDRQIAIHDKYHLKPIYFFLLGDLSKFDRNLPFTNIHLRAIIQKIADKYQVGMHPSYSSNHRQGQLEKEKQRLEGILGKPIDKSRQHFLKLKLPETYQKLIAQGIKEDYSMGYSREIGFRAGICSPFYFYDLSKEETTPLLVRPFCMMDSTFKFYLKTRSSEIIYTAKPLIDHVKQVKGELITVFHNESLGSHKIWRNWGDVYETLIRAALPK